MHRLLIQIQVPLNGKVQRSVKPLVKSPWAAIALVCVFGPAGLLYATFSGCLLVLSVLSVLAWEAGKWSELWWLIFWPLAGGFLWIGWMIPLTLVTELTDFWRLIGLGKYFYPLAVTEAFAALCTFLSMLYLFALNSELSVGVFLLTWLICAIWAAIAAGTHNRKIFEKISSAR
jgi:hypothetical protein